MLSFFVRFPPKGDEDVLEPQVVKNHVSHFRPEWEPITCSGREPPLHLLHVELTKLKHSLEETGNNLYLLEAFRICVKEKIYPPLWVLNALSNRFDHYMKSSDSSLDNSFGFSRVGQGKGRTPTAFEKDSKRHRDRLLCLMCFKLEALGLTPPECYRAMSSLLARLPEGAGVEVGRPKVDVLRHMELTNVAIKNAVEAAEEEWKEERLLALQGGEELSEAERNEVLSNFYNSELPKSMQRVGK